MKKLLFILLLPALLAAQSFSRWNYKDAKPNDVTADAKMLADFQAAMDNHATGDLSIHKSYRYVGTTDSSFEITDLNAKVILMFDPRPIGGVTALTREDTVVVLSKHSPIKKQVMVGGDGILPPRQAIAAPRPSLVALAVLKGIALRKAVDDSIKANPGAGNTKAKRAKVWQAKVKEFKAKKKGVGK